MVPALDENGLEMTYDHINVHMIDRGAEACPGRKEGMCYVGI